MTSEELAEEVDKFIKESQARVVGTGNEQYSFGDDQLFERLPIDDLFEWAQEELRDVAVYATMVSIRLERLRKLLVEKSMRQLVFDEERDSAID